MKYLVSAQDKTEVLLAVAKNIKNQPRKVKEQKSLIEFARTVVGEPNYSFSMTLNPVHGPRRRSTNINDAEQAMDWFLHVLNTKCFGHGYRRKKLEVGIFAMLEGLGYGDQPHWHGVIRLPSSLAVVRFLKAFRHASVHTKRFGRQSHLVPYFEGCWFKYITKLGLENFNPQFLRAGTP